MSLNVRSVGRSNRGVVFEFGVVVAALVGVALWSQVAGALLPLAATLLGSGTTLATLPAPMLATSAVFACGVVGTGVVYARARGFALGTELPGRADLSAVGGAVVVPGVLVGGTALVAGWTGVAYVDLTNAAFAADAPLAPILALMALSAAVAVPVLVVVCQVVAQNALRAALDGDAAVVLTTLVAGFVLTGHSGLTVAPETGKLAVAVLLVLAFGVARYATEHVERDRLRTAAYLPAVLLLAVVVASALLGVESLAGGLFTLAQVGVVGYAAYGYERTGSLLLPALAYLSLLLATDAVVLLEAGF